MGLWDGEAPARLAAPAAYLARRVKHLQVAVRRIAIPPLVYATRAHEILEDAQRDMLSGVDAPWSGAGLRATADSLAATEFVVDTLKPLLDGRGRRSSRSKSNWPGSTPRCSGCAAKAAANGRGSKR